MSEIIVVTAEDLEQNKRLDTFLAKKFPDYSRVLIKKFFEEGAFRSKVKLNLKKMPTLGTQIEFCAPAPVDKEIKAQNIPLEILFEDKYLVIVNKPQGLVTHPAPGNYDGTLVNAILFHCPDIQTIGNEKRPGIVHRLDKGTSGVMVIAKEQKTHEGLVDLFSSHNIERKYEAICLGSRLPQEKKLESLIGRNPKNRLKMTSKVAQGKEAITYMKSLEYFERFTHVELKLETGRTHQIRVHLSELLNTPIMNDHTYGRTKEEKAVMNSKVKSLVKDFEHPFLHAKVLGFKHPITKEELYFEAPAPKIFQEVLESLRDNGQSNL